MVKEKMVPYITKLLEHDKSSWGPNFDPKNNDWQQLNLSGVCSSSPRVSFVDLNPSARTTLGTQKSFCCV